jgi:hypothetical protein
MLAVVLVVRARLRLQVDVSGWGVSVFRDVLPEQAVQGLKV